MRAEEGRELRYEAALVVVDDRLRLPVVDGVDSGREGPLAGTVSTVVIARPRRMARMTTWNTKSESARGSRADRKFTSAPGSIPELAEVVYLHVYEKYETAANNVYAVSEGEGVPA